ncbi:MAG TPA: hypothetical protein VG248_00780 [Caulobacteraceae bacterium]|nr:hypothetical protein [Caulobacteraceae bacterium]
MQKKTTALIGAAAALAAAPAATQAAPSQVAPAPVAASYAELLQPIPNALERLQASDGADQAKLIEAQYGPAPVAHHHHHHHNQWRRSRAWYLRHGYSWYGGAWVIRPRHAHHHHHNNHHHNNY